MDMAEILHYFFNEIATAPFAADDVRTSDSPKTNSVVSDSSQVLLALFHIGQERADRANVALINL